MWMLLLIACGSGSGRLPADTSSPEEPGAAPVLKLATTSLDLGTVVMGYSTQRSVEVCNAGDAPLQVLDISWQDGGAPFSAGSLDTIAPSLCEPLTVDFAPGVVGGWADLLNIESDGGSDQIDVFGVADHGGLVGGSIDFAEVMVGCSVSADALITNTEAVSLDVEAWSLTDGDFSLRSLPSLPWTLGPGESLSVEVLLTPLSSSDLQADLSFTTSDAEAPDATVHLMGTGGAVDLMEERWLVDDPRVDVLFAVDTSPSMWTRLPTLLDNMAELFDGLGDEDWQIAAVVADDGCVLGSPLSAPDADAFAAMVPYGDLAPEGAERAFERLGVALAQATTGGCNDGLLRDGARLELVVVTDWDDQSEGSVGAWRSTLQDSVTHDALLRVHGVTGDHPEGCADATDAPSVYQLAQATGGLSLSICALDDPLVPPLWALGQSIASDRRTQEFALDETSVPATIEVLLDNAPVDGWVYDDAVNSIFFDEPVDGTSTLTVRYAPQLGDCGR